MRFRTTVALQAATQATSAKGHVSYTYETVDGYEAVPAQVFAVTDERREPDMTVTEDRFDVILAGDHPGITTEMVVLAGDDGVFDILRVAPTLRLKTTVLKARRVSH
jgi:hypothetical protein